MTPWIRNRIAFRRPVDAEALRGLLQDLASQEPWAFRGVTMEAGLPVVALRTAWRPARRLAETLSAAFPEVPVELVYQDVLAGFEAGEAYLGGRQREVLYYDGNEAELGALEAQVNRRLA